MSYRNDCMDCRPQAPCYRHEVIADGKSVRVPMMLRDSMQRSVAANPAVRAMEDREAREQARRDHDEWLRNGQPIQHDGISPYHAKVLAANTRSNAAALAHSQRRHAAAQAARDHAGNASDNAYAEMCEQLQNAHRRA